MVYKIGKITIEGFKSIRSLRDFELRSLNVLIGANGAGKSNFVFDRIDGQHPDSLLANILCDLRYACDPHHCGNSVPRQRL